MSGKKTKHIARKASAGRKKVHFLRKYLAIISFTAVLVCGVTTIVGLHYSQSNTTDVLGISGINPPPCPGRFPCKFPTPTPKPTCKNTKNICTAMGSCRGSGGRSVGSCGSGKVCCSFY